MARGVSLLLLISTLSLISTRVHCSRVFSSIENKYQGVKSTICQYTVKIKTSDNSPPYIIDDIISLVFHGWSKNQVYMENLNDRPGQRFRRGSTETIRVDGQCLYEVCAVGLWTDKPSSWTPKKVKVFKANSSGFISDALFALTCGKWTVTVVTFGHSQGYNQFNVSSNYTLD